MIQSFIFLIRSFETVGEGVRIDSECTYRDYQLMWGKNVSLNKKKKIPNLNQNWLKLLDMKIACKSMVFVNYVSVSV